MLICLHQVVISRVHVDICEQTCVSRTSLSLYNFGRRFLGCSRYKVGPKCHFFIWVDNPTCSCGNEIAPLTLENMSRLQSTNSWEVQILTFTQ